MIEKLKSLHADWCRLTGQNPADLKYQATERYFWDFYNNGFEADDLRCVLVFVIHQNSKREPKFRQRLNIHNFFSDMGKLASLLAESRAWERNKRPRPSSKETALAEFRGVRPEHPSASARSVKDILKDVAKEI